MARTASVAVLVLASLVASAQGTRLGEESAAQLFDGISASAPGDRCNVPKLGLGFCRTASGGRGRYDLLCDGGPGCHMTNLECRAACQADAECIAYEIHHESGRCEIHKSPITQVEPVHDRRSSCYVCDAMVTLPPPPPPPPTGHRCEVPKLGLGYCRTAAGGHGTYDLYCSGHPACHMTNLECRAACERRSDCVAYEIDHRNGRCELHKEPITRVQSSTPSGSRSCYVCGAPPPPPPTRCDVPKLGLGYCRTPYGVGDFEVRCAGHPACHMTNLECRTACESKRWCVAYEINHDSGRCELHRDFVTWVHPVSDRSSSCYSCA